MDNSERSRLARFQRRRIRAERSMRRSRTTIVPYHPYNTQTYVSSNANVCSSGLQYTKTRDVLRAPAKNIRSRSIVNEDGTTITETVVWDMTSNINASIKIHGNNLGASSSTPKLPMTTTTDLSTQSAISSTEQNPKRTCQYSANEIEELQTICFAELSQKNNNNTSTIGESERPFKRRKYEEPWNFGPPNQICQYCNATLWYEERTDKKKWGSKNPKFYICCQQGKIQLPPISKPPPILEELFSFQGGRKSRKFRENIRLYNSIFAFTSIGGNVDHRINKGGAPYVYRISGQNHHKIGSLLPIEGERPKFAQLYIHDTANEVSNRIQAVSRDNYAPNLEEEIVKGLVNMLDEHNALAKVFRMARDRFNESDVAPVRIRLIGNRTRNPSTYNLPTASEIAALIVGELEDTDLSRDVVIEHKCNGLQRITDLHPSFMAMQYPLLFPYGEDGYQLGIKYKPINGGRENKRKCVTMREFYAYRLQQRMNESLIVASAGKLYQQYLVDAYTCIEEERVRWIRANQAQLRSELYKGLKDAVLKGDTTPSSVGKRIVLPPSFTGGPRYMAQNFQDAMAICRWAGNPDLFITFTANPKWAEVQSFLNLIPGQKPEDRPDIISRVFKIKLEQLMEDLVQRKHFGQVLAAIYTIEFQKRGLPHAHILLFLHRSAKIPTPKKIDEIISAELPDCQVDPIGFAAVSQFMVHGPCGKANPNSPCMTKDGCSKHFPKKFCNETTFDESGYPIYRRRDDMRFVSKNGVQLDNRFVVPHNIDLVVKYQAHINVEWCNKGRSIKYLFKYITKGSDKATIILQHNLTNTNETTIEEVQKIDEIKSYLDCRYISACEACWRIFSFDIHYRSVPVERLSFHLPGEHTVTFRDSDYLDNVVNRFDIQTTMFTEWMKANSLYEDARELTYADFPTKWVWQSNYKFWKRREKGKSIGRIYYAHPTSGEKFYLRMLLNVIKGPRNFEEIRTINGVTYPTYKAACYALGLLDGDQEWNDAILQASQWSTGNQLRELFVTILLYCEVCDPLELWNKNWDILTEDLLYRQRRILRIPDLCLSDNQLKNYGLYDVEKILLRYNKSIKDFPGLPFPDSALIIEQGNRLIREEKSYDTQQLKKDHEVLYKDLNVEQLAVYNTVIQSVKETSGGLYFVYGAGGTGKTYLYKTIIARLRSEGKIVLAVASSGIAALLLPGGRTAHSRFTIPIELTNHSTCDIRQGTHLAELIQQTSLIIWDEAPMNHKNAFETVDRTFRDILRFNDPNSAEKVFGGKTVLLGGDFRQTLPVVPKGTREDVVRASINRSYIWDFGKTFTLTKNMRIQDAQSFRDWVLALGDGTLPTTTMNGNEDDSWIEIPNDLLIPSTANPIADIVSSTYPNINSMYQVPNYLQTRAILTPTNDTVDEVNSYILNSLPGEITTYHSSDSCCKGTSELLDQDIMYPIEFLNTLTFPGLPNHELHLKIGIPVMLLRNINQSEGLCNGTRLIITQLAPLVIEGKIITGSNIGAKVFIPRIIMTATETKLPFILKRRQFPVRPSFCMTINKSQGQTLENVGVYLPKPVFSHGQLYVAASRVTTREGIKFLIKNDDPSECNTTRNIVYAEVLSAVNNN